MIERAEKMHKRIKKAERLLEKIVIALDAEMVNWCIDEIDDDDDHITELTNTILDFPDRLREYANEMRSWLSYQILYTSNNEYDLNYPHSTLSPSSGYRIPYSDHLGSQYRLPLSIYSSQCLVLAGRVLAACHYCRCFL